MELIGALEQSAIGSDTDDTDDNIDITLKHFLLQFRYQPHHFVADGLQRSQVLDLQPTTSTNPPRVKKKALAFIPPLLRYTNIYRYTYTYVYDYINIIFTN